MGWGGGRRLTGERKRAGHGRDEGHGSVWAHRVPPNSALQVAEMAALVRVF